MAYTITDLTKNKFRFNDTIKQDEINKGLDTEISANQDKVKLSGFREGKVPKNVIKQKLGPEMMLDVANKLAREAFGKFLEEHKELRIIGRPIINFGESVSPDADLDFFVEYETYPTIVLPNFSEFSIENIISSVEELDVERAIDSLRLKYAVYSETADKSQEKDRVNIDFVGTVDNVPFQGGAANNQPVDLGLGKMLPEFEEGLFGVVTGQEIKVEVNFPENYGAPELAGKKAEFAIKVNKVERPELCELDDEFFKKTHSKDLQDLRAKISNKLHTDLNKILSNAKKNKIVELFDKEIAVEVPENIVKDEAEEDKKRFLAHHNKSNQGNIKESDIPTEIFMEEARKKIKISLIIDAITEANNIDVSEEDVLPFLQQTQGEHASAALEYYKGQPKMYQNLVMNVLEEKLFDYVFGLLQKQDKPTKLDELMR